MTEAGFLPMQIFVEGPEVPQSGDRNPTVFVAGEAEKMIGDAAAGCGELDLP